CCSNGPYASYRPIILTLSIRPGKQPKDYASLLGCSDRKFYRIGALYKSEGACLLLCVVNCFILTFG
ncbi:MAG: hypothetical protein M3342_17400, partial [Bacteroidota bacterium]|nr:hypothetical protein [Bacteroidota bacterium]